MRRTLRYFVLLLVVGPTPTFASPITLPDLLDPNATLIDFEDYPTSGNLVTPINGSLTIGDVTFSSLTGNLSIFDISVSGWSADGTEIGGKTLFPGGEPDSAIVMDFAAPIRQFLLGWGDPNFSGNQLLAFDARGTLLETANVALGSGGGSHAAWIGFARKDADIMRIIVQPDQSLPSGDDYVIDNIRYSAVAVPEPTTITLVAVGSFAAGLFSRRRQRLRARRREHIA